MSWTTGFFAGCRAKSLPIYTSCVISTLESIDWSRFLARASLPSPGPEALQALRGQSILVTGAGGSIGSALAARLAELEPSRLVLLEASESHLFTLERAWADTGMASRVTMVLGSACDAPLLDEISSVYQPSLVFHAAAHKHVPLLEGQPLAAIANNVFGTLDLTRAARGARMVLLSTDKAVEPAAVLGATKRVAEQIVLDVGGTVLRLGNVLASSGSVAEVFARQIGEGGPLCVTDPAARRYFLTLEEAVNLLLAVALEPSGRTLFAPRIVEPHYVADLAQFMAKELAPGREIAIEFTHPRPGDKETERLWSGTESAKPADDVGLVAIESQPVGSERLRSGLAALHATLEVRDISAAIAQMCVLVPEYTPSAALLELAAHNARVSS
jgi:FlaA1/EpsC-like NDP-sugar epimerase